MRCTFSGKPARKRAFRAANMGHRTGEVYSVHVIEDLHAFAGDDGLHGYISHGIRTTTMAADYIEISIMLVK